MPRLRCPLPSSLASPSPFHSSLSVATRAFGHAPTKTIFTKRCDSRCYYEFSFLKRCSPRYIRGDFETPRISRPSFREASRVNQFETNGRGPFDRVFFSFRNQLFSNRISNKSFWTIGSKWFDKVFISILFVFSLFFFPWINLLREQIISDNWKGMIRSGICFVFFFLFFFFNRSVISEK